jgi:hypothetical protein
VAAERPANHVSILKNKTDCEREDLSTFADTAGKFGHTIGDPEHSFFDKARSTLFDLGKNQDQKEDGGYLGYPNPEFFVTVHDNAIEWLVENVGNPRTDIRKKSDWIANEISRTKNSIKLAKNVLSIMIGDSALEFRQGESHILDGERIQLERSIIDVTQSHRESIHHHSQGIANTEPDVR